MTLITLYTTAGSFFAVISIPVLVLIFCFSRKRRASLLQRLGVRTGFSKDLSGRRRLWVHALSVGEVTSALPLIRCLKKRHPDLPVVFTASTKTGFETARRLMGRQGEALTEAVGYFPFDILWSIRRVVRQINPCGVVLVETDLWPGFLHVMKRSNIPVMLVNARLSLRSLRGYQTFIRFFNPLFASFSKILVQSSQDRDRFLALGLSEGRVQVTGNLKFDQDLEKNTSEGMRRMLGVADDVPIIVAGSTHEGEEEILLSVFYALKAQALKDGRAGMALVVAPRDPSRCRKIQKAAEIKFPATRLLSGITGPVEEAFPVILVDCMGVLASLYTVADAAFVGGSLVNEGGHNPLEPAAAACPVCFGPDMSDFLEITDLLTDAGGAVSVVDADALKTVLAGWLENDAQRLETGKNARQVFWAHSGAAERMVDEMEAQGIV